MENTLNDNSTTGDVIDLFIRIANTVSSPDTIGIYHAEEGEVMKFGVYYAAESGHVYTDLFDLEILLIAFITLDDSWERVKDDITDGTLLVQFIQYLCEVALEEVGN